MSYTMQDVAQLAAAGAVDQPAEARVGALRALWGLACASENWVPLWQNPDVLAALLVGAALDQPD